MEFRDRVFPIPRLPYERRESSLENPTGRKIRRWLNLIMVPLDNTVTLTPVRISRDSVPATIAAIQNPDGVANLIVNFTAPAVATSGYVIPPLQALQISTEEFSGEDQEYFDLSDIWIVSNALGVVYRVPVFWSARG